ncbi:hypothetical protein ACN42_g1796 [Penicillium freii]|uniref:ABC-2 type transporter domain-containing protein n=1 Tax=Penicillium freii TaxID=48697 RepID=A0A101MRA5_PENFR|nr:hypothetical protein ACN42_g1796 [Penicillium freii]
MSFIAVAYVPSFLEDRATFAKERANGLYNATLFMVSNFLIGLPFLCMLYTFPKTRISNRLYSPDINFILDCLVLALKLPPRRRRLFTSVIWTFLDLVAAESLVVLVTAIFPSFVIALALVAFANGLWMSVGGFLVTPIILNPFWKYVFHYIDYQVRPNNSLGLFD